MSTAPYSISCSNRIVLQKRHGPFSLGCWNTGTCSSRCFPEPQRPLPVTPFHGEQWGELDVPLPQGLMADVNAAVVKQFLHVTLAEGKR